MEPYEQTMAHGGGAAVREMCRFHMKEGAVHQSLTRIAERLRSLGIAYAVVGGMALSAHGYVRATVDVDVLLAPDDLERVHRELEGLGYVAVFAGSKSLRDTQSSVRVEFLVAGQYPGDGKPKPVAFPDPAEVGVEIDGIVYVQLPTLVELKLASGMTNAGRLKDLADVQELIRVLGLPRDFTARLNPFVGEKFTELWDALQFDRAD